MNKEWLKLRSELLFESTPELFKEDCGRVLNRLKKSYACAEDNRKVEIVDLLAELAIDMKSYLKKWHLQNPEKWVVLEESIIDSVVLDVMELLTTWGAKDKAQYIKNEIENVLTSNRYKISIKTDQGVLNNRLGNDAAFGLCEAMRRGASLVTTNPVMVNTIRKDESEKWNAFRDRMRQENPEKTPEELATMLAIEIVYEFCQELWPIYQATDGKDGYVSMQVSPRNATNAEKMYAEVKFVYDAVSNKMGTEQANLVFKVPATEAALQTVEAMTSEGIGVNITGSCSVSQHLALGEVIERGRSKVNFLTMMSGRLDDRIAEELEEKGVENALVLSRKASEAIVKRSCKILEERGYKKSYLLIASLRGPWNIEAGLANKETPVYITCFPAKAVEYDEIERENSSKIDEVMDAEIITSLRKSEIFCQGYDVDGLDPSEFAEYYPVKVTLESFVANYDETVAYMTN